MNIDEKMNGIIDGMLVEILDPSIPQRLHEEHPEFYEEICVLIYSVALAKTADIARAATNPLNAGTEDFPENAVVDFDIYSVALQKLKDGLEDILKRRQPENN